MSYGKWKKASNTFVNKAYPKRSKIRGGRGFSLSGVIHPRRAGSGRKSTKRLYKNWKLGIAGLASSYAVGQILGVRKGFSLANYSSTERGDLRRIRKNQLQIKKQIAVGRMRESNNYAQEF